MVCSGCAIWQSGRVEALARLLLAFQAIAKLKRQGDRVEPREHYQRLVDQGTLRIAEGLAGATARPAMGCDQGEVGLTWKLLSVIVSDSPNCSIVSLGGCLYSPGCSDGVRGKF